MSLLAARVSISQDRPLDPFYLGRRRCYIQYLVDPSVPHLLETRHVSNVYL